MRQFKKLAMNDLANFQCGKAPSSPNAYTET